RFEAECYGGRQVAQLFIRTHGMQPHKDADRWHSSSSGHTGCSLTRMQTGGTALHQDTRDAAHKDADRCKALHQDTRDAASQRCRQVAKLFIRTHGMQPHKDADRWQSSSSGPRDAAY
ncbi:hypothetical protein KUCAC02_035483, partial [Chaenocephalus aceratus]